MLWKLAWRNLWRHRTRTLIMTSAVALTYALMLVALGINDDGHARMLAEAARAAGGDILVHGDEYWATRASDIVIQDGARVLGRVRGVAGVEVALPRVLINGLLGTSADNRPVMLEGVRPELEARLNDVASDIVEGDFLAGARDDPIVIGARMAERLEAEPGDRIVLTATRPDGEVTRALFHLTGIFESGTRAVDEVVAYTTLDAAQRALGMEGRLTQIGVLAAEGVESDALARRIEAVLGAPALEVLDWREAVPEMVGLIQIDDAFGQIYLAVIYAVVLFSIANAFLMAVMERVREFGLLNAIGLRNARIGRMLLGETVLMTALAMAIGLVLALAGHLAVDHWGISLAGYGIEDIEMAGIDVADMVMYSRITPVKWIVASVLVAVATVASALYPAWRASRLAPAEAMRFYE